ncbi:MAG: IclR family transcriptional regulator [Arcobacter sp.]|uniref:IclR family transcriptional regulator n=1 Tax=Arcobacter sp. TaxID=1872629 RepID=UPI003AFFBA36
MQNQNKSLTKGLSILKSIMKSNKPLTANYLCQKHDIDKSTMSRLITTLLCEGFIEYVENSKEIVLSDIMKNISQKESRDKIVEKTEALLDEIFYLTDECSYIGVLDNNAVLYLNQIDKSNRVLKTRDSVGLHAPLHANAFGKILLAFEDVNLKSLDLKKYTVNTITTVTKLQKEIELVQQRGYAIGFEEYEFGLFSIAVPYFNNRREFVGTVGISGLSARVNEEKSHELAKKIFNLVNPVI